MTYIKSLPWSKILTSCLAVFLVSSTLYTKPADCSEGTHITRQHWSFTGPFGKYDQAQLQRGFKVFREVCATCHSTKYLTFRNLADPGGPSFTLEQVKTLAEEYNIQDGPNDQGDMFERPGKPSDRFPLRFANETLARMANAGALPPDLSLIAKARSFSAGFPGFIIDMLTLYQEHGSDYLYNFLTRYPEHAPNGVICPDGQVYNEVFTGGACIAMPRPIVDGQVVFDDGSPNTMADQARDVTAFLTWLAEPKMEDRKTMGLKVISFLLAFAVILYYLKKRIWSRVS